ncbi:NAD(P)-binding protein [Aspergillus sclerotioniger CBS 115572]|uniref:NAD(P)-binding protein n=1 Tax=Aspergillus sclerotioniger CBS 115572 TaxID=1450535 RepID=A0A317VCS0_9EURO|nr:NAD(P)-binding protein [Aspergillus sclerotioniger CBS 115572]PWY72164.1 NAD(P)-binding protein [Aspergillus sclerotioniger CBS 115572]
MPLQYLLTGSTGGLGSQILSHFLTLLPKNNFAASSSNPSNSERFTSQGIQFRTVNYDDPATLETAFADVENLLFVSTNTFDVERRRRQHWNVVDVARRVGVKHIWYTSLAFGGFDSHSKASVQQAHLMTEEMLRGSGVTYTSIREGVYTDAFPVFMNWYPSTTTLYLPSSTRDGKIAFTLRSELAEATAKLMIQGGHEDQIVLLTAKETITFGEIVGIINETTGREVVLEFVDPETYVRVCAETDEGGKKEGFFRQLVGWYEGIGKGELETTDGLMGRVLGREPVGARRAVRELLEGVKGGEYVWHQNYAK